MPTNTSLMCKNHSLTTLTPLHKLSQSSILKVGRQMPLQHLLIITLNLALFGHFSYQKWAEKGGPKTTLGQKMSKPSYLGYLGLKPGATKTRDQGPGNGWDWPGPGPGFQHLALLNPGSRVLMLSRSMILYIATRCVLLQVLQSNRLAIQSIDKLYFYYISLNCIKIYNKYVFKIIIYNIIIIYNNYYTCY